MPWACALTGDLVTEPDPGYWPRQTREPVRFADAVAALAAQEISVFVEIGPDGTLSALGPAALGAGDESEGGEHGAVFVPVLRPGQPAAAAVTAALARAFVRGVAVDWAAVLPGGRRVDLPTYAFQRRRYWPQPVPGAQGVPAVVAAGGDGAGTAAEARFWAAVEGGDLQSLAQMMAEPLPADGGRSFSETLPALASWRRRERDRSATESWRYRISWAPLTEPDRVTLSGTWLVVVPAGPPGELAEGCVRALAARGAQVVLAEVAAAELDRERLAARLGQVLISGTAGISAVVSLLALDEAPLAGHRVVPAGLAGTLALVQALGDAGVDAPLWVLTCGAVAAGPGEVLASPVQGQVWGLGRVAGVEYRDRWGGLVDLPPVLDDRAAGRLCAVLAPGGLAPGGLAPGGLAPGGLAPGGLAGCGEDQVAIRGAGVMARRLTRAPLPRDDRPWVPGGSVLVTGGTGAIGARVARWLAGRGAPRVVLTSRSGPEALSTAELAADLARAGTSAEVMACDVAEKTEIAGLLHRITATGPRLAGVMHAAGALDDGVLDGMDAGRLAAVLAAKAAGAAHLDELTGEAALEQFVLFSSAASTFGGAGQGNYAAANAYLDGLAQRRAARGLAGLSVAWGPWAGGMAQASDAVRERLRRGPLPGMDPDLAIKALGQALGGPDALLAVMDVDWAQYAVAPTPFVRDLPDVAQLATAPGAAAGQAPAHGDLARRLAGLPRNRQLQELTDLVRAGTAGVLGHASAEAIEADRAFGDLGFDSLTSLEMRQHLAAVTGLKLPATLLFDYPTPAVLAAHLRTELLGDPAGDTAVPVVTAAPVAGEPIAIVGMSCRYPGGVRDPEGMWELLAAGTDAISGFPQDRGWDLEELYDPDPDHPGTSYSRHGGFMHDAAEFDPGFFGISPREALAMDPQQRLLLEVCWEAIERAGISPSVLRGSQTGVFAGAFMSGYGISEGYLLTGAATSVLSGRVAFTLGLEGPAVTVDTACSSSLVALHLACQALRSGECTMALAGGVTVLATPGLFVGFSRQGGMSIDGRCKSFGAGADGSGWAEGAGVLMVERLSDARRNGHNVLAVIRGSALNQDGASNGLTAPNGPSQQRVIRAALAAAGVGAADVDVVEAHGSGTSLGDPIEAQALLATYGQERPEGHPLWLGSVKSNFGHAQCAAGAAGMIKMVLALQHGELPRTLHADEPSPHVDWSAGEVRLLTEPVPWPADGGRPRRAGISAFGISGTNAHIILEGPEAGEAAGTETGAATPAPVVDAGVVPWVVSGRTAAGLAAQAARLAAHVAATPGLDPADVGWSLAATRSVFEHRAVVTGTGPGQLAAGLSAVAAGEPAAGVVTGSVPAGGAGRVVFVFPGQGAQWAGMGRELAAASPVFAARLAECGRALAPHVGLGSAGRDRGRRGRPGPGVRRGHPAGAVGGDGVPGGGVAGRRGHPGRGAGPFPG